MKKFAVKSGRIASVQVVYYSDISMECILTLL